MIVCNLTGSSALLGRFTVQGFSTDVMHDKEPMALLCLEDGSSALKPSASSPKHAPWQRTFLKKQILFPSIGAPGKCGGKSINTAVTELRGSYTGGRLHLLGHTKFLAGVRAAALPAALSQQVVRMFKKMFPAPGPYPKPPSEVSVPLKRILLSAHVFFHNRICSSPKLLFLPKLLHNL